MEEKPKSKEVIDRRLFLVKSSKYLLTGLLVPSTISMANTKIIEDKEKEYILSEHFHSYVIDTTKCIGCGTCVKSCQKENDVPDHFYRTWVESYIHTFTGEEYVASPNGGKDGFNQTIVDYNTGKAYFVPKICNHCQNTPCKQVCPVGASYVAPNGAVMVDEKHCVGCGYCIQACPYGSRFLHPVKKVANKCTWCFHRITKFKKPACVQNCPVNARLFGDLKNPEDPVRQLIFSERVGVLQPTLLTKPKCYYLGLDQEVR